MTDLLRFEEELRRALRAFPIKVRHQLLEALTAADEERSRAIGRSYQSGAVPSLSELLIDLEEEPVARALIVGDFGS